MRSLTPARLRGRTCRLLLAAALASALAATALPSAADAASISSDGESVSVLDRSFFVGGSTEANDVTVRAEPISSGSLIVVTDRAGVTTEHQSNGSCFRVSATEARCPVLSDAAVGVSLAGGNDRMEYQARHRGSVDLGPGADVLSAGTRELNGGGMQPVSYAGGSGSDSISYVQAPTGVSMTASDRVANDGPRLERENVSADFETFFGSTFADALLSGTSNTDAMFGLGGDDQLIGGGGDDVFVSPVIDGADHYDGGAGRDIMTYEGRTQALVIDLDNVADDGQLGEKDNVASNVENVIGGTAGDRISSLGADSFLIGREGNDVLLGGAGVDSLEGNTGIDRLEGGTGNDTLSAGGGGRDTILGQENDDAIFANDGEGDTVDCGTETDRADVDGLDSSRSCENRIGVGTLRLTPKVVKSKVGKPAHVRLSWRHPKAWKQLKTIELRLLSKHGIPVGEVTIRPSRERIAAHGAVALVRKQTRLGHKGKTVSARLALRLDESLAGQTLRAEVEATDTRGGRQLETGAASIRVAR